MLFATYFSVYKKIILVYSNYISDNYAKINRRASINLRLFGKYPIKIELSRLVQNII